VEDLRKKLSSDKERQIGDEAIKKFGEAVVQGDFELARSLLDQARAHYERAGRLSREQLDPAGEAEALRGAAAAAAELGDPSAAVEMLLLVGRPAAAAGPTRRWAACYLSYAIINNNVLTQIFKKTYFKFFRKSRIFIFKYFYYIFF
jgi:hypothetical protein